MLLKQRYDRFLIHKMREKILSKRHIFRQQTTHKTWRWRGHFVTAGVLWGRIKMHSTNKNVQKPDRGRLVICRRFQAQEFPRGPSGSPGQAIQCRTGVGIPILCCFSLLFVCLFGVYRPTREFFTHLTSPLPAKGCRFWPMLGTHGRMPRVTVGIYAC